MNGDVDRRIMIKFCVALNESPTESLKMIKSTGKYEECRQAFVYKWHLRFRFARVTINDGPKNNRPAIICSVKD